MDLGARARAVHAEVRPPLGLARLLARDIAGVIRLPRRPARLLGRASSRPGPGPAALRGLAQLADPVPQPLPQAPAAPLPVRPRVLVVLVGAKAVGANDLFRADLVLSQRVVRVADATAATTTGAPSSSSSSSRSRRRPCAPAASPAARRGVQLALHLVAGHVLAVLDVELLPGAGGAPVLGPPHVRL